MRTNAYSSSRHLISEITQCLHNDWGNVWKTIAAEITFAKLVENPAGKLFKTWAQNLHYYFRYLHFTMLPVGKKY